MLKSIYIFFKKFSNAISIGGFFIYYVLNAEAVIATDHEAFRNRDDGDTALILSVKSGNVEEVKRLIDTGTIDVNQKNQKGYTALSCATSTPNLMITYNTESQIRYDIIDALLAHPSCDINLQNAAGNTPLHFSCIECDYEAVKRLIAHQSCDINLQNISGQTPLMIAIAYEYWNIVELLLDHPQVQLDRKDRSNQTCFRYIFKAGYMELANRVKMHPKFPQEELENLTPQELERLNKPPRSVQDLLLSLMAAPPA